MRNSLFAQIVWAHALIFAIGLVILAVGLEKTYSNDSLHSKKSTIEMKYARNASSLRNNESRLSNLDATQEDASMQAHKAVLEINLWRLQQQIADNNAQLKAVKSALAKLPADSWLPVGLRREIKHDLEELNKLSAEVSSALKVLSADILLVEKIVDH